MALWYCVSFCCMTKWTSSMYSYIPSVLGPLPPPQFHPSRSWKGLLVVKSLSHVQLFAPPRTVARQAPMTIVFSKQEYWNGLPFPSPGDLPDPGIEPVSPALAGWFFTTEPPGKPKHSLWESAKGEVNLWCPHPLKSWVAWIGWANAEWINEPYC